MGLFFLVLSEIVFPQETYKLCLVHLPTYSLEMSNKIQSLHIGIDRKSKHIMEKWLTLSLDLIIISRNRRQFLHILLLYLSSSVGLTNFFKNLFFYSAHTYVCWVCFSPCLHSCLPAFPPSSSSKPSTTYKNRSVDYDFIKKSHSWCPDCGRNELCFRVSWIVIKGISNKGLLSIMKIEYF